MKNVTIHNHEFSIGDTYYSAGPLQSGRIEQWTFSGDRYDQNRAEVGNMFVTSEGARIMALYMKSFTRSHKYHTRTSNVN